MWSELLSSHAHLSLIGGPRLNDTQSLSMVHRHLQHPLYLLQELGLQSRDSGGRSHEPGRRT